MDAAYGNDSRLRAGMTVLEVPFVGVATWSDEKVLAKVRELVLPAMAWPASPKPMNETRGVLRRAIVDPWVYQFDTARKNAFGRTVRRFGGRSAG